MASSNPATFRVAYVVFAMRARAGQAHDTTDWRTVLNRPGAGVLESARSRECVDCSTRACAVQWRKGIEQRLEKQSERKQKLYRYG
jgi:hypothetical protein